MVFIFIIESLYNLNIVLLSTTSSGPWKIAPLERHYCTKGIGRHYPVIIISAVGQLISEIRWTGGHSDT